MTDSTRKENARRKKTKAKNTKRKKINVSGGAGWLVGVDCFLGAV